MHTPYSNIVNGGLIDFQDASMMHASPVHSSMILPSAQQNPVYYVGQPAPQPVFASPAPQVYGAPAQPMFAAPQQPHGFPAPAAQTVQAGQCFTGPPSFVHFNGQTYKPVEEPSAGSTVGGDSAKAEITDMRGLERKIEERVHDKVNEFMERQDRSRSRKERSIESHAYHSELAKLNSGLRRR